MYIFFSSLSMINDAFYDLELRHRGMVVRRLDSDIMELDTFSQGSSNIPGHFFLILHFSNINSYFSLAIQYDNW